MEERLLCVARCARRFARGEKVALFCGADAEGKIVKALYGSPGARPGGLFLLVEEVLMDASVSEGETVAVMESPAVAAAPGAPFSAAYRATLE